MPYMYEKVFSHLLPFIETEVNWMYICVRSHFTNSLQMHMDSSTFLGMGTYAQAVDTRPLSFLPHGLGMGLLCMVTSVGEMVKLQWHKSPVATHTI